MENENISPSTNNKRGSSPYLYYFLISILLVFSGIFIFLLFNPTILINSKNYISQIELLFKNKYFTPPSTSNLNPEITVVPTTPVSFKEVIPIKQGEETYNISQGKTDGPKISKATINPHDPKMDVKQTVTVYANHTQPITWVKVTVYSDNKTEVHNLTLSSGTNLSGTWSGTWITNDTHLHKWGFLIDSSDSVNQSQVGIAIR